MSFRNSFKLVSANFFEFWKVLLFKVIVFAVGIGLLAIFSFPIAECFSSFFDQVLSFVTSFAILPNVAYLFKSAFLLMGVFFDSVVAMAALHTTAFIFVLGVVCIVIPFLNNLLIPALGENIYGYMSSLSRFSLTGSLIKKLGKNSAFAIVKTFVDLVINGLIIVGVYFIVSIASKGGAIMFTVPILLFLFLVISISLKSMLIIGWMPSLVAENKNAFIAFGHGIKTTFKNFFKNLSNILVLNFISLLVIMFVGFYGIPILCPFFTFVLVVFQMVMFFTAHGMRYYIDLDTIITPAKLEKQDGFKKTKNIL
ncbi:MAG: hypothetical protein RR140_00195 [Clostridia bacterium]